MLLDKGWDCKIYFEIAQDSLRLPKIAQDRQREPKPAQNRLFLQIQFLLPILRNTAKFCHIFHSVFSFYGIPNDHLVLTISTFKLVWKKTEQAVAELYQAQASELINPISYGLSDSMVHMEASKIVGDFRISTFL